MLADDNWVRLTTYLGDSDRTQGGLLGSVLLDVHARYRMTASTLMRGIEGFGRSRRLRTDSILETSHGLPIISCAVDEPSRIQSMLASIPQTPESGLSTLEPLQLRAAGFRELRLKWPNAAKLTVYMPLHQRTKTRAAFTAVCDLLYRRGAINATVLLSVDGSLSGHRADRRVFSRNDDVPVNVVAIGPTEVMATASSEIAEILPGVTTTLEHVEVCKLDGQFIARPRQPPHIGEWDGPAPWQKLTIYSTYSSPSGRRLSHELMRRLRAIDMAGATSLTGIWGFCGVRPPQGDKRLQLKRNVPMITIVVDAPERIQRAFSVVDQLTQRHGLVTSTTVLPVARREFPSPGSTVHRLTPGSRGARLSAARAGATRLGLWQHHSRNQQPVLGQPSSGDDVRKSS